MKYTVKYFQTARTDRSIIKSYLSQFSSTAYTRLFEKIKDKIEITKNNPYIYPSYEHRPQFRRIVVDDYLVFYKVNEESKTIEVYRILHGMMDIEQIL